MKQSKLKWIVLLLLPGTAFAHLGVGETTGFVHGFIHPLLGIDHLLVMLAVGFWAVQIGGRACWVVPSVFVMFMIVGGLFSFLGMSIPFVQLGILLSILALGILITGAFKFSFIYCVLLVGFFAIFHGYAHAIEMSSASSLTFYILGFSLASIMLHGVGMLVSVAVQMLISAKALFYR
jgi:urease accessory protein